jgi:hypothetical protein
MLLGTLIEKNSPCEGFGIKTVSGRWKIWSRKGMGQTAPCFWIGMAFSRIIISETAS